MRDLGIFMVVFGSLPFILRRPYIGVLVWTWLAFMNPHRLTWGMAFDFPFSAVVAAFLVLSVAVSTEPKRFPWSGVTIVWMLFFLWTALTTVFALEPEAAGFEWSRWWKINLVCLITLIVMRSRERLHLLVWVIVLSLGFYGLKGGLFAVITGGEFMVFGPELSFIGDNTSMGLALIMTLPLMRYCGVEAKNVWIRRAILVAMGLTVLAIVATQSRGAFLGLAAVGAILVFKSGNLIRVGLLVTVLAFGVLSFMPEKWFDRMETIQTYEEDGSAMGRINAWWFAANLASDRLIGGGFGTFSDELFLKYAPEPEDVHDAHSIYFEVLGEHGFFGLFLFLLLGILVYRSASWTIRRTRDRPDLSWAKNLAAMVQVSLFGYAVCGAFLGHAYFDFYYTLIGIVVLTRKIVEQELMTENPQGAGQVTPGAATDHGKGGLTC